MVQIQKRTAVWHCSLTPLKQRHSTGQWNTNNSKMFYCGTICWETSYFMLLKRGEKWSSNWCSLRVCCFTVKSNALKITVKSKTVPKKDILYCTAICSQENYKLYHISLMECTEHFILKQWASNLTSLLLPNKVQPHSLRNFVSFLNEMKMKHKDFPFHSGGD